MLFCAVLCSAASAYLLGSLDFGILVSTVFYKKDIRKFGSGNAGMTNILRTFGKGAAAATLTGDIGKGLCAVVLAKEIFSHLAPSVSALYFGYIAAICALLGHLFPLYFGFKGGKGVSVAAGTILGIQPLLVLPLLLIFLGVVLKTKIVSLSSILVAALYPVVTCIYYTVWSNGSNPWINTGFALVMAALVIWMHRANIVRLRAGTEYRFGEKKNQQ